MKTFLLLLCFAVMGSGQAYAAMFGDFAVPDALSPRVVATQGDGTAVVAVPLESGSELTLCIPARNRVVRENSALEHIGRNLNASGELALLNVGGRLWIGNRNKRPGVDLYEGYTYKNGVVYPFSFSVDSAAAPSTETRRALARIGFFPDLADSGAAEPILSAMEHLDAGEIPKALETLTRAESMLRSPDDPGRRYVELSRAYAHELQGENQEAAERFAKARDAFPDDVEAATRFYGTSGIMSEAEAAVKALLDAAAANPDEPEFLETLGSLYLAYDDTEAATAYFEEALDLNPTSGTALLNLAHLHAQKADYEDSYRRVANLRYYHPYIPEESLPNLSGKLSEIRMRELAGEPLALGALTAFLRVSDAPPRTSLANASHGIAKTVPVGPETIILEQPQEIIQQEIIVVQNPVTVIQPPLEVYIPSSYVVYHGTCWWYSWSWWRPSRHWKHGDWDRWYSHRPAWRPHRDSRPPPRYHSVRRRDWDGRDRLGGRTDAAWRTRSASSTRLGYRIPGRPGTGMGRVRRDATASPGRNPASVGRTTGALGGERSALPSRSPGWRTPGTGVADSAIRRGDGVRSNRSQSSTVRPERAASATATANPSSPVVRGDTPSQRRVARPGAGQARREGLRGNDRPSTPMRTARPPVVASGMQGQASRAGVVQSSPRTPNANRSAPASSRPAGRPSEAQRQRVRPGNAQTPSITAAAPARQSAPQARPAQPRPSQPIRQTAPQQVRQPRASQPSARQPEQQPRSRNVAPPQASRQAPRAAQPSRNSSPQLRQGGRQNNPRSQAPRQNNDREERRQGRRR